MRQRRQPAGWDQLVDSSGAFLPEACWLGHRMDIIYQELPAGEFAELAVMPAESVPADETEDWILVDNLAVERSTLARRQDLARELATVLSGAKLEGVSALGMFRVGPANKHNPLGLRKDRWYCLYAIEGIARVADLTAQGLPELPHVCTGPLWTPDEFRSILVYAPPTSELAASGKLQGYLLRAPGDSRRYGVTVADYQE